MSNKNSYMQMLKFTLFSISAGVIQVVSFALFNDVFKWIYWPAYLTSLILSIVWNFTFNRRFTFKAAVNIPVAMAQLALFYVVFTPVSTYLGNVAVAAFEGVKFIDYIVQFSTMTSNFVLEFLFCKFVMYRNKENTL